MLHSHCPQRLHHAPLYFLLGESEIAWAEGHILPERRHEKLVVVNVKNMKELPALTDDQRKQLEAIDNLPDDQIDFSDIPEMTEHKGPVYIGLMYRPGKTSVTIRLDSDMVEWFKTQGKGWQTKMNWALRLYFASHRKTGAIVGKP